MKISEKLDMINYFNVGVQGTVPSLFLLLSQSGFAFNFYPPSLFADREGVRKSCTVVQNKNHSSLDIGMSSSLYAISSS